MATAIPAMRGHFGSTEYYLVMMRAKELADRLVIPKDLEDWEDMTLEERFQREVNFNRVKKHIAPYLAHDSDRFFGAFIVDIYNAEGVSFEPIENVVSSKLPTLYQKAGNVFGFLYLEGNEVLVPLDGQHRLAAIRFAITGKDEKGKEIPGLSPNLDVANDSCTVILVKHDAKKARKIFNKVNRYAKATSKTDNLITADDDIIAIITREEVADRIIHERLVNFDSNTLSPTSECFTTLATLYEATSLILEDCYGKIDRTTLPSIPNQKLYRDKVNEFWTEICRNVTLFESAIHDPSEGGDDKRREIRKDFLLGKPIAQLALVDAVLRLRQPEDDGTRFSWGEVTDRVNSIDWSSDASLWQGVLMSGTKVVAGKQAAKFAGRFIAYLLGQRLTQKETDALRQQFQSHAGNEKKPLPPQMH